VTAQFNKERLLRINRELGGDFDRMAFDHLALWNAAYRRMENVLVSRKDRSSTRGPHFRVSGAARAAHRELAQVHRRCVAGAGMEAGWQ